MQRINRNMLDLTGYVNVWREQVYTATAGQTDFKLPTGITYPVNRNMINVFLNGDLQRKGLDYTEFDNTTIKTTEGLRAGDVVHLRFQVPYSEVLTTWPEIKIEEAKKVANVMRQQTFTVTEGQTLFSLNEQYAPGTYTLSVFLNGIKQRVGIDYLETDSGKVTFTVGLKGTDRLEMNWLAPSGQFLLGTVKIEDAPDESVPMKKISGLLSQFSDVSINVKTKGAIVDGIFDSTQALIDAHDSLPASGGKIFVPTGRLLVTRPVTFTKTVIIEGASVSHLVGTSGSVVVLSGTGELIFKGSSSGIRDLFVDGVTGNSSNGVTMLNNRPWVDNVTITNQGKHGLQIGSETDSTVNVNSGHISNLRTKLNKGDGLKIVHANAVSPDANVITVLNVDSGYNDGNGVTLLNCFDNQFIGVHSEGNKGYGIQLKNAGSNVFLKPYCEANTLGELNGDALSKYNYVIGHRRDASFKSFVFDSPDNYVMGRSSSKGLFPVSNRQGSEVFTVSKDGISGYWDIEEDETSRDLVFTLKGTSASASIKFKSSGGGLITESPDRLQVGGGAIVTKFIQVGATLSFGAIAAQSQVERTLSVPGASVYDVVTVVPNSAPETGISWNVFVSSADTVTVRLSNFTSASINTTARGWKVLVTKLV